MIIKQYSDYILLLPMKPKTMHYLKKFFSLKFHSLSFLKFFYYRFSHIMRQIRLVHLLVFCLLFIFACQKNTPSIKNRYIVENNEEELIPLSESSAYVSLKNEKGSFPLSIQEKPASLVTSSKEFPQVIRALEDLRSDIGCVTNNKPKLLIDKFQQSDHIVIVGTIGQNPLIDSLIVQKKIDVTNIKDKWETFLIQVIENPMPDIKRALIITGSDKRGTIYGIYDLSEQIGVSPWYWWADIPVVKHKNLYVLPGQHSLGEPAVKYRGIFINHEYPGFGGWAKEKFGSLNHKLYEKVFELMLRLKANYLWPAMWGDNFYDDDPLNIKKASEYGIIMGTSHHEPMMRSCLEWRKHGKGKWDYTLNDASLKQYWLKGAERMKSHECIVTVGMRGYGDVEMGADTNIVLLNRIIKEQRNILKNVYGKDTASIPQVWTLYKEVQDYYEMGMKVPEDITLLFCDDNNGNIRKLPDMKEKPWPGGYGMYYHFTFVGDPRSYKWVNTVPVSKIWEQMHLTYSYGVNKIWMANVGGIKPIEIPTEFFLEYAWNPDKWPLERLPEYTRIWAEKKFGAEYADDIADIVTKYTKYNGRRKPELLEPNVFSLANFREAEKIVDDYNGIANKAEQIYNALSPAYKNAFYQLVLYPVKACSVVTEMFFAAEKNKLYAKQGRAATNQFAARVEELFAKDAELARYYNRTMSNGKWKSFMNQTNIGYRDWQEPKKDTMPEIEKIKLPDIADMGVMVEGEDSCWRPDEKREAILPEFDVFNKQSYYFEVFNRGSIPFSYSVITEVPWLTVTPDKGKINLEERLWVSVDWPNVPYGTQQVPVSVLGPDNKKIILYAVIHNPKFPRPSDVKGFVESNHYISMEAGHFSRSIDSPPIKWQCIPDYGRTLTGMTPFPVTVESQQPGANSPRLEYDVYLFNTGEINVDAYFSPSINFTNSSGLRYAISFDNEPPEIMNIGNIRTRTIITPVDSVYDVWNKSASDNIRIMTSRHIINKPGEHVLKFWMIDPGLVLQKIVIETGKVKPSYLGPPESYNGKEITEN